MAKGIFVALEDLEESNVTVEPVDEVEYIQAQNDLDGHSDVIDDLYDTYQSAGQDTNTIEAVAESIPNTNDTPVESTIIATEALIRKLGLPNYSLESYKDKTNKALRASLEETVEKTNEAKKSLFKKIWEKIVSFFKKAYEFITGLFKKKTKDVKKKVDDLNINTAEEGIQKAKEKYEETKKKYDIETVYDILGIEKKDGKLVYKDSHHLLSMLFIPHNEIITSSKIDHTLIELEEEFKKSNIVIDQLSNIEIGSKDFSVNTRKLSKNREQLDTNYKEDDTQKEDFYVEIPSKNEIDNLLSKIDNFSKKIADAENKALSIFTKYENKEGEIDVFEKRSLLEIKYIKTNFFIFQHFIRSALRYCDRSTSLLKDIEEFTSFKTH